MIREILGSCFANKDELNNILNNVNKELRGNIEVIESEDGIYGRISIDEDLIYDVRIGKNVCEFYVKIRSSNDLELVSNSGFNEVVKAISSAASYPSEVIISKVLPSMSMYILLSGRDLPKAFPSIRITYRKSFYEASASFCRVSVDEDLCKVLNALLKVAEKYWNEMFS